MIMNPRKLYSGAFGRRLFLIMALLSSILIGTLGFINYTFTKRTILDNAENHLLEIVRSRNNQIEMWFDDRAHKIILATNLPAVQDIVSRLISGTSKTESDSVFLNEILRLQLSEDEAFRTAGIFSLDGKLLVGPNNSEHFVINPEESDLFKQAKETLEPVFGNLHFENSHEMALHIAKSICNTQGDPLAVLFFDVHPQKFFDQILNDYTGLGQTGELFIVGSDSTMLTKSRQSEHPPEMTHKMTTKGVVDCLKGESSVEVYHGFDGEKVIGAYIWMPRNKWALIAEMNLKEAFQPLYIVRTQTYLALTVGILLILFSTIIISQRLSLPLMKLVNASDDVAKGNLNVRIDSISKDEFGDLTRQFNNMVESLQHSRQEIETSNQQLLHSEKLAAIGRLVASIVHEMRNPLSTVKMNLQILKKKNVLNEIESEHLNIASDQVGRLERMLNELLEYSKPVVPNYLNMDLKPLLLKVKYDRNDLLKSKQINVIEEYPSYPVIIRSDSDILTRVFDNLISNAIQASKENSDLRIRLTENDDRIIVEIQDFGKGMSEKVKAKLFERFFTTREDGVGLGMSNVKRFLDVLNAEIEVESELDKGTTMKVSIPKSNSRI